MSGWRKRQISEKMYESGLFVDGSFEDMDDYDKEAVQLYADLMVEQALKDVLEIIADDRNYNKSVYTTYDKSMAEGMAHQLTNKITEHFGLLKASGFMSDKGYKISTEEKYQRFVEKRNERNRF
jgi:hypothetical protein